MIAEELESFLANRQRAERSVPRFVERELRTFLDCGVRARGFVRVHCDWCDHDKVAKKSRVWQADGGKGGVEFDLHPAGKRVAMVTPVETPQGKPSPKQRRITGSFS